jgi:hypothetical protein
MSRKLNVYGGCLDGKNRVIVAASSLKEAAMLFGVSYYSAKNYVCDTGNAREIEEAMGEPGKVFSKAE